MERTFRYSNHIQDVSKIGSDLSELASEWTIPGSELRQVVVIIEELLSNIVRFAFNDPDDHVIEVRVSKTGRVLAIRITDDGIPFNPLDYHPPSTTDPASPDAGGMGITLVRTFSDSIEYSREKDKNHLTITKVIKSNG
ncbi:MAG: ATP-binding protein [Bacteroidales bacterium]